VLINLSWKMFSHFNENDRARRLVIGALAFLAVAFVSACDRLERPSPNPYFAESPPPAKQEFRWSNGKLPKSFDPAQAAAAPETDIIRTIYLGLTTVDPRTLEAAPGVAEKWTASEDGRTWTFQLRKDAKWTNGKNVTARDFVRSWNRLFAMRERSAHPELLRNFARARAADTTGRPAAKTTGTPTVSTTDSDEPPPLITKPQNRSQAPRPSESQTEETHVKPPEQLMIGALSDAVLTVTLQTADPDLPDLVANPMFSPVFGDGSEFASGAEPTAIVTNGPFRISEVSKSGVVVERSDNFSGAISGSLDTIHFVAAETADEALEAYRSGRVDAVTNAEFEPLAVKLLAPFQDFRKATHGALNFYEFNTSKAPYSDRRVREALTIAIERERLTEGELEGAMRPALRFLPFGGKPQKEIVQDIERAKKLLASAGFENGEGFPTIKLVVNRNDTQQRIARAVARMWKQNLGLNTEIVVNETTEIAAIRKSGDFDLLRRGIVFPTSDAQSNLNAIFDPVDPGFLGETSSVRPEPQPSAASNTANRDSHETQTRLAAASPRVVPTEAEALYQLWAVPLYFPTSFSLVKPYIEGFEPNGLDVLSVTDIRINSSWQPKRPTGES
jgi:oligopeptide transport system substrate-binding protein